MQKQLLELQGKFERVALHPEYQAVMLRDVAKLEKLSSKAKGLEDKLRRREAELKDELESAALQKRKADALQEDALLVAPLQREIGKHRKELARCKQQIAEEARKRGEIKEEAERLRRDLAHAQRVQEGVHWSPTDAAKRLQKDRELESLQEAVATLTDEKRKLEEELSRASDGLSQYRQRERVQARLRDQLVQLTDKAKMERLKGLEAGRKDAAQLVKAARADASRAEAARSKLAQALVRSKAEAEKAKEEAALVARAYPQSVMMAEAARSAKADAARAEAAQALAEKELVEVRDKAEQAEAAMMSEAAKAGAEALSAESARRSKTKAESARNEAMVALGAAEEAAARARDNGKEEAKKARDAAAKSVAAALAQKEAMARALKAAKADLEEAQAEARTGQVQVRVRVHVAGAEGIELAAVPVPVPDVAMEAAVETAASPAPATTNAVAAAAMPNSSASFELRLLQAKVKEMTATEVRLREQQKKAESKRNEMEKRAIFLEKALVVFGSRCDLSTAIALQSLPNSTQPCRVRFETSGPRSLGGTRLWMGFVRGDANVASFHRLGERQDLNSFVGAGILVLRMSGDGPGRDADRSQAIAIPPEEVVVAFRPKTADNHLVRIQLSDDGGVVVKAGIPGEEAEEVDWLRAKKLAAFPAPLLIQNVAAAQQQVPRSRRVDVADAMARLKLRVRALPTETQWSEWQVASWSARSIDDDDCSALATLAANGACERLRKLELDRNRIGDVGLTAIARAATDGHFVQVEHLDLSDNLISKDGAAAFASSCADGSFSRLQTLHLYSNRLGDEGTLAICKAFQLGGPHGFLMSDVLVLGLHFNQIGDDGVRALARVVFGGGLASCRELYLHGNQIGSEGMAALTDVLSQGALSQCRKLTTYNNKVSDKDVVNMLKRRGGQQYAGTSASPPPLDPEKI